MNEERMQLGEQLNMEFMTLQSGNLCCGFEMAAVEEILWNFQISPVPCLPDYFEGVCNWNGDLIPVVSLEKLAGEEKTSGNIRQVILLVKADGYECGFLTSGMPRMIQGQENGRLTGETPEWLGKCAVKSVYGGEMVFYVLDLEKTLENLVVYR